MLYAPIAVAPIIAGSGPLAPLLAGGLGVAGLIGWLLSRGHKNKPTPVATNPVTGQPVPTNADGSYWGIDPNSGLPGQLIDQVWGAQAPEGLSTPGMTAGQYVQGRAGLPFWANNRFVGMSEQLGGWDKFVEWSMKPENWGSIMTVLGQPWGQSEVDQLPPGYTPDMQAAQPPEDPSMQPNEGTTSNVPEGQQGPSGVDAQGNPVYPTTVTGGLNPGATLPVIGGAAGAGLLGSILAGGGGGQPAVNQIPPPDYSVTTWGSPDDPQGLPPDDPLSSIPLGATLNPPGTSMTWGAPPLAGNPTVGGFLGAPLVSGGGGGGGTGTLGGMLGGPLGGAVAGGLGGLLGGILGGGNGFTQQQPGQQQPGQAATPPINLVIPPSTTTTPAPYATLPGQTPVQSVFGPPPLPNRPIPSLGMLLKGLTA
jgi:hypothetical protein